MARRNITHDQCRTFGHAWFEADGDYRPLFGTLFALRCERCGATRNDIVDAHGDLASRNYRYPDGYKESERLTRAEYRLRLINARPKRKRKAS